MEQDKRQYKNDNDVTLSGIITDVGYPRSSRDGKVYTLVHIRCMRLSSNTDVIPVVIPHAIVDRRSLVDICEQHNHITICGKLCASYNKNAPAHRKTRVWVRATFCSNTTDDDNVDDKNIITINTTFAYSPQLRHTPQGRLIADTFIRITPRVYVPAIAWGKVAEQIKGHDTETPVTITARLQSRDYETYDGETNKVEEYTTVEVSIQEVK